MTLHPVKEQLQVHELQDAEGVYTQLMAVLSSLAERGLVHCDCNEFNVLVRMPPRPKLHRTFQYKMLVLKKGGASSGCQRARPASAM